MADPLGLIGNSGGVNNHMPQKAINNNQPNNGPNFKDVLMKNIDQVNKLQQDADKAIEDLSTGRRDDISSVMIANEKAKLAFNMLLQVRNEMMDAYDEIKQVRV